MYWHCPVFFVSFYTALIDISTPNTSLGLREISLAFSDVREFYGALDSFLITYLRAELWAFWVEIW